MPVSYRLRGIRVLVLSAREIIGLPQILLGIEDVTERTERADAALHESEARLGSWPTRRR